MKLKDKLEGLTCVVHRDVPATGVISYGQTHEPHCELCCMTWEKVLLSGAMSLPRMTMGLRHFRAWQTQRARAA